MLKLKHSILVNQNLYATFQSLMNEKMASSAAKKMKGYATQLDQKQKEHVKFMSNLLKEYGELDEAGNPVLEYSAGTDEESKPVGYKLKDAEAFKTAASSYLESEFELEISPLFAAELSGVQISPNELFVLEPFIADLNNL